MNIGITNLGIISIRKKFQKTIIEVPNCSKFLTVQNSSQFKIPHSSKFLTVQNSSQFKIPHSSKFLTVQNS
jgi:hypothetical protein